MAITVIASRGVEYKGEPEPLASAPVVIRAERHSGWGGGWAARIRAIDPRAKGGLDRDFLRPWSRDLSRAGHGMVEFRVSEAGVFEIEYIRRSFERARAYLAIYPTGEVRAVGYHLPGGPRPGELDQAIAEALAELADSETDPEPGHDPEPEPEPDPEPEPEPEHSAEPAAVADPVAAAEPEQAPEPEPRRPRSRRGCRRSEVSYEWWTSIIPAEPPARGIGDWVRDAERLLAAYATPERPVQARFLVASGSGWAPMADPAECSLAEWQGLRGELLAAIESEEGSVFAAGSQVLAGALADGRPWLVLAIPGLAPAELAELAAHSAEERAVLVLAAVGGAA